MASFIMAGGNLFFYFMSLQMLYINSHEGILQALQIVISTYFMMLQRNCLYVSFSWLAY